MIIAISVIIFKVKNGKKSVNIVETNNNIAYEYFVLTSQEKAGVIDKKGNLILETQYTNIDIPNPSKDVFIVYTEDEAQVLNQKGEKILTDYETIEAVKSSEENNEMEANVLKYKKDNLYGLIDLDGKKITEAVYDEIVSLDYRPGRILVKKQDQYGILDVVGNVVIDVKYDKIVADGYCSKEETYEKTGYIVAQKAKDGINFGYIDAKGNVVLDTKYEAIERALEYDDENAYLIAMQKGKKGVFKNDKKIIDLNFQEIHYSDLSKVFIVNKNGKYGFYHLNGKNILKPEYTSYSIAGN